MAGVLHGDRGGEGGRSDRHVDRRTFIGAGDTHGNKGEQEEPVTDGRANKGLQGDEEKAGRDPEQRRKRSGGESRSLTAVRGEKEKKKKKAVPGRVES